jgi:hypothetical protein
LTSTTIDTNPIDMVAKPSSPRKKISRARSMGQVYDGGLRGGNRRR